MSNSVRPHRRQPTRLPCPWDSPGKNTGVGCHFLLQSMKVRSESEVAQLCPTLRNPRDCSLPGSSVQEIFQARVLEWSAIAFSVINVNYYYYSLYSFYSKRRIQLSTREWNCICVQKAKEMWMQLFMISKLFHWKSQARKPTLSPYLVLTSHSPPVDMYNTLWC